MKLNPTLFQSAGLIIILLLNISVLPGQTSSKADSLIQVISQMKSDTAKLRNILLLSQELKMKDPEKALEYAGEAFHLALELRDEPGQLDALYEKSAAFRSSGQLDSAILYSETAIGQCTKLGDEKRLADHLFMYGILLRDNGDNDRSQDQYRKALSLYLRLRDSTGISNTYNGIGIVFKIKGQYDSAVYYYLKSIRVAQSTGKLKSISAQMINMSKIYVAMGDLENAKKYLLEGIEFAKKYNRTDHLVIAYTDLGIVAYEERDFDLALDYYNQALPLSLQIGKKTSTADLYNNIGNIYFEQKGDYDKAYIYYKKALAVFMDLNNKAGMLVNLMNIAVIYERRGSYEKALAMNDTCQKIAIELGDVAMLKRVYENIFSIYYNTGDFKKACDYQTRFYELNDSLFDLEKAKIIADLNLSYEKEKDQARILTLENKTLMLENRNLTYLFSGSGIVLILVFFFAYYSQRTRKNRIIAEQRITQLEEEKKLLAARSIVLGQEEERKRIAKELHDGLGVLLSSAKMHFTTIREKSPESQPMIDKATKLLEQASGDVRRISHNMMPGLLTKYGLYEAVEDLIEQVDEMEGMHAEVKIEGEKTRLNENTEIMLYRIIQEMVNNTLKHAGAKNIGLDIHIQPGHLQIKYWDDGKGFDFADKIREKSMGLTSLQSRVKFLGGELDFGEVSEAGTVYSFNIPLT